MTDNKEDSINLIEKDLIKQKDWKYMGEVDSAKRPINSLLDLGDVHFEQVEVLEPISTKQNDEILTMTLRRLREGTFDNYRYTFETKVIEEPEVDQLVDQPEEGLVEDQHAILSLYNEIECDMLKISDFGGLGYSQDIRVVRREEKERKKKTNFKKIKNVTILEK